MLKTVTFERFVMNTVSTDSMEIIDKTSSLKRISIISTSYQEHAVEHSKSASYSDYGTIRRRIKYVKYYTIKELSYKSSQNLDRQTDIKTVW